MRHKYVTQFYTTQKYTLILEGHALICNNLIGTLFEDQSGMGITNLLSCNNSSIVPPRLDSLQGSWWLLLSFYHLTFLDNIILRAIQWREALVEMYIRMNVCICFHTSGHNPVPRACGFVKCLLTLFLYKYSELMFDLSKQPRRNFPSMIAG